MSKAKIKGKSQEPKARSYFETRIFDELGVTPEYNKIKLKIEDLEKGTDREIEHQIFTEDEEGNILITPFDLDRYLIQYDNRSATPTKPNINNSRRKIFAVKRFKTPETYEDQKTGETKTKKYDFPKGAKTQPFRTKGILRKWEKKEKIVTLVLTEGYFKATAGDINGLDIIGLSSITHIKDKETETMYTDVLRVIKDCKVENVILLYDGDARNISTKDLIAGDDIKNRPHLFITMALAARELLKGLGVDIYYAEVNSRELENGHPKGLDDLYQAYPDQKTAITKDLVTFGKPTSYFNRINIRFDASKLYNWYQMSSVNTFYSFHADVILKRDFVYWGTTYYYDEKNNTCEIKVPGNAQNYFRVATDYYRWVSVPNKYQQAERGFVKWSKVTIQDDHPNKKGEKKFIDFIQKYLTFCNVPSHTNYQQAVNNCFNVYSPFDYEEEEGECPVILEFIKHIFQEHYELGLDYIQLLYQLPTQTLPILCLVSKENKTGKSTFLKLLKAIFKQNCTIIGNAELNSEFNAGWSTKLIVGCEETLVDKKPTIEKIKALSTADRVNMNRKGKDHEEIEFFAKFILASNNENNFIYASKSDIRYWVRKVPVIEKERVNMLQEMIEEIPAFLYYLNRRKMSTKNETRMWFREDLIRTAALDKLIQHSRSGIEKEIYEYLKTIYLDFGDSEVLLTPTNIINLILKRKTDISYITSILKDNLGVKHAGDGKVMSYKVPYWDEITIMGQTNVDRREHSYKGRPYLFPVDKILDEYDLQVWKSVHQAPKEETDTEPEQPKLETPKIHQKTIDEEIRRNKENPVPVPDDDMPF